MSRPSPAYCPNRRQLLTAGAALLGTAALPRLALAQAPTDRRLILVILRGGLDGLAAIAPHGDRDLARHRNRIQLPGPGNAGGVIDLDGFFGLHPALAPLAAGYRGGDLLAVHAVHTPYRARSHFDAQNLLENGTDRPFGADSGWLNRALAALGGDTGGLAISQNVPLVLAGDEAVGAYYPSRIGSASTALLDRLQLLYDHAPRFQAALASARDTQAIVGEDTVGGGRLQATALADAAARLMLQADGPRVAVMEAGGWDTHSNQGAATGQLANRLGDLATLLTGLRDGLAPVWDQTAVLAITEFGRTVAENGSGGTDHGTASAALLYGGAVAGGRVLADWPGLRPDQLHEGRDLAPTTDLYAVLKGVLRDHLGLSDTMLSRSVFPDSGSVSAMRGLIA